MLGLQETGPTGTSSTKSYSCVACSATFHGLASLLVHQASHASEVSSPQGATSPACTHCGGLFDSKELFEKHHCMLLSPPETEDLHISECGEGLQDTQDIQKHKVHEMKALTESDNNSPIKTEVMTDGNYSAPVLFSSPPSHATEESHHESSQTISEVKTKDCLPPSNMNLMQHPISQEHDDELLPKCVSSSVISTEAHSESFENKTIYLENETANSSDSDELKDQSTVTNKQTLLKMLASAYMSQRQPPQIKWGQNKRALPPRKVSPRAPVQAPVAISGSNPECTDNQLREKVAQYAPYRERFISNRTFTNKSRVVSMTKALCPVVALETRQKLCRDNVIGRFQCGICRRVFQNKDSLIMHHALHRKERVKFCRRCRQFVISVISAPDSHICSGYVGTTTTFPTMMYPRKLFHCQLCNRSYTRRHRLKTHKCQWKAALARKDAAVYNTGEGTFAKGQLLSTKSSAGHVNVAVNTEGYNSIKSEEEAESLGEDKFQINTTSFKCETLPESFPPFLPNNSKLNLVQSTENINEMLKKEDSVHSSASEDEGTAGSNTEGNESLERGQWTVPLDDAEVDVLTDDENSNNLDEASKENTDDEVIILEPSVNCETSNLTHSINKDFQVQVSDSGARRFSCNRCQKSYSRRFTLNQHLMICRSRKFLEQNSFGNVSANILGLKKRFPCPHCGSSFTRKDNMNMHRKRCQSMRRTNPLEGNGRLDKQNQSAQENTFVLPPVSKNQVRQEGSSNVGGGSWGIMSLPSVLPRKVTCECGASFTCPRLLFEHLQMHALESYICSHCGENLQSWADFEAHQQLHLQTSRPKIEDRGSQQQSHVQSQPQQESNIQLSVQNPKKDSQDLFRSRFNRRPFTGPYVCHRCKKIFRLRKSLLRHLTRSCKGDSTTENKHSCSRCGMTFQNSLAQEVHMRANTCTPAFKPLRCPVCVRWFSSLEGLKRHLLSHSQAESLMCQMCGCKCSSHAALEEHKRNIHNTNKDFESPTVQSAHVSQSSSSDAFRCQICQRSYPKLQSLKDHLRKVHKPKHLNPVSIRSFETKELTKGIVQQSQAKQFQCQICARTYQDIQSLKNHRRRVHRILGGGLQPSRGNLQQSHSYPFQCQICSRTYPDIRSLRNHRRRVHRILGGLEIYKGISHQNQSSLFKCQICQRSYPDLEALNNHKRREHCLLRDVLESTKMSATHVEQPQSNVFHGTSPIGEFESIA
ncbi:zinc finger protein 62 [Clarias gariepinus]|uniref:zinc finger protein 62 n=1 Tax=Clarias gariepinus TaxID=13013 RepID=UPI00234E0374|nr:zinc finger protein 62 [Clarias gariepinus]